jgi:hypothetical protein
MTRKLCSLGVTGSYLVIESYWKLSGDWDLLKVVWSLGVTGSCLVIGSYWKLSGDWELLKVVWSLGVTGSFLVIGSYWKLSGHWELLELPITRKLPVIPYEQTTFSNSQSPDNFQ